jgi:hypothetical protein
MTVLCTASQIELHSDSRIFNPLSGFDTFPRRNFPNIEKDIQVPNPKVFKEIDAPIASTDATSLPNVGQCAAHLELLQAINHVRREVLNSTQLDAILDIKPQKKTVVRRYTRETIEVKDKNFAQRRQIKWPFYLRLGVARFFVWLKRMDESLALNPNRVLELPACPPLGVLSVCFRAIANDQMFSSRGIRPF